MTIRLRRDRPDFTAESTAGTPIFMTISATDGAPLQPPRDYTPVCTTELGAGRNEGRLRGPQCQGRRAEHRCPGRPSRLGWGHRRCDRSRADFPSLTLTERSLWPTT